MVQNSRCRGRLKGFHGNGHDLSADVFFSGSSNPGAVDTEDLHERLDAAVARGVAGAGLAHRAVLAARLTRTLPQAGADAGLGAISGEALARTLGLSRAAVHKHVNHLRTLGFGVESLPGAGYRLERPFADLVAAEAVLPFILGLSRPETPWMAGLPYFYLPRCESTNLSLKEAMAPRRAAGRGATDGPVPHSGAPALSAPGALPAGALMVTDEQTGGRGRLERTWWSEAGRDLTFSVLLRPSLAPTQAHLLSLAAALAVAEVLETLPGLEGRVAVKWPNDVLLGDEKVCGILLEGSMDFDRLHWAVAGIGLNVNSTPSALVAARPRPRPVSLRECLGYDVPRAPLLAALLARLTRRWIDLEDRGDPGPGAPTRPGGSGAAGVLAALRQRDALAGRQVEVLSGSGRQGHKDVVASGEAAGIGPEGQLLVRSASGETVAVFAGDVTLRAVN
jgi:BirA family biotin operon repressor/biotin-[acetyl-CoA-carboxylase] ligase